MRDVGVTRRLGDLTELSKELKRKIWRERKAFSRARHMKQ
jgi:hypothetical protein